MSKGLQIAPLGVTLGEPAGIGAEITAKAWTDRKAKALPPFFLIGAASVFDAHGLSIPIKKISHPAEALDVYYDALPVFDLPLKQAISPGHPQGHSAAMVIGAIDRAVEWALDGAISAIVTNPLQKSVLYDAGFKDPGHTEYLARLAGHNPQHSVMMLAVPELRVVPLSVHVPLKDVPSKITTERLIHVLTIMHKALQNQFGIPAPRIAVAGLNPHAGEAGALGREEIEIISPVLDHLRAEGMTLIGPLAADTLFHEDARKAYDAVLCMYHDQALIPLKTLDFHHGVNVTLGLPFIRTSPDHGTALDIAGKNTARPDSLIAAIELAARLAHSSRSGGPS